MTIQEANRVYESWKNYVEVADKWSRLFMCSIPESFLPYPKEEIEEALNITAERYWNIGDKETSEAIKTTIAGFLWDHKKDEDVINSLSKMLKMMEDSPELKATLLEKSKEGRDSWLKQTRLLDKKALANNSSSNHDK